MSVLVLGRTALADLLTIDDHLEAAERAFAALGAGTADLPLPMHIQGDGGSFHAKGAALKLERPYAALKFNGNFPDNGRKHGLPTVQGALLLFDGQTGTPLALMDSIELTIARTAAATALAARHLARPDSKVLTICGCGAQALAQVRHVANVLPIERVLAWDMQPDRASALAEALADELAVEPVSEPGLTSATLESDVIITCTTAQSAFLRPQHVRLGTFIAAIGADNPAKQEIDPALLAQSRVITDRTEQCAAMGDLHHAVEAGLMRGADVVGELSEIVCGYIPGRETASEITLFDSTGLAVQDVSVAAMAFERAQAQGAGKQLDLS